MEQKIEIKVFVAEKDEPGPNDGLSLVGLEFMEDEELVLGVAINTQAARELAAALIRVCTQAEQINAGQNS